MTVYSMDLGIDSRSTGGGDGVLRSPYPLEISLTTGNLVGGVYTPTALASWRGVSSGDVFVVRVFDLTIQGTRLSSVSWGACIASTLEYAPRRLFIGETFVRAGQPQAAQYVLLALVFAALDFIIMFGYAFFGSQAVRFLKTSGALWLERACGGALLALAGSLAFYRRATA